MVPSLASRQGQVYPHKQRACRLRGKSTLQTTNTYIRTAAELYFITCSSLLPRGASMVLATCVRRQVAVTLHVPSCRTDPGSLIVRMAASGRDLGGNLGPQNQCRTETLVESGLVAECHLSHLASNDVFHRQQPHLEN